MMPPSTVAPSTYNVTERLAWRHFTTSQRAKDAAIYRWYLFPHSFSPDLVLALIDEWCLTASDFVLDPFVGSGTTLLATQERNIRSVGYDLSPLAVFVSNAKSFPYRYDDLKEAWMELKRELGRASVYPERPVYPDLVRRALSEGRAEALESISNAIDASGGDSPQRNFFRLALISIIPDVSQAVANGGWLRWLYMGDKAASVVGRFADRVELMLSDIADVNDGPGCKIEAIVADARTMPASDNTYDAVITSPPYPNRHDYTRIFGVELMFAFHDWERNRELRYQTFQSHPEARPTRPPAGGYVPPRRLEQVIGTLSDVRIQDMLRGYFLDMYLCLRETFRVCKQGARIAFVLGNVRYGGKGIAVDEFTAELGEVVGLSCTEIRAVRWRGNSAQQMGRYGRIAMRESIVMFEKR